jgi:hypothetical protein
VAPADRKAVYMGYAFLYGVFGSLLGANIGAFLYGAYMTPVINTPDASNHARIFWLGFAVFDVFAALGLILFARRFGQDTPASRNTATSIMYFVYALILLLGGVFLWVAFSPSPPQYRTAVQALIFVALGGGGLVMNYSRR